MHDRVSSNGVAMRAIKVLYPNIIDTIHTQSIDHVGEHFKTPTLEELIRSYSICMEGANNCLELEIDGPVVFKCYKIISTLTASLHTAHFPHLSAVCLASNLVVVVVNQPPFSSWYIMGEVVLSQDWTTFFAKFEGNRLIVYKCSKLPNCLFHVRLQEWSQPVTLLIC